MNIHPIFTHFPIALLVLYSLLEVFRVRIITRHSHYFAIKAFLLIVGTLSAIVTFLTGDMAEELLTKTHPELHGLIETHSTFAGVSLALFGLLAAAYIMQILNEQGYWRSITNNKLVRTLVNWVMLAAPVIAVLGLAAITITGGLGGAIVYGPNVDPFVSAIYSLFAPAN